MIKQFLKPSWKKVIIFIIILILAFIFGLFLSSFGTLSLPLIIQYAFFIINQLTRAPFLVLTFPFYFLGEFGSSAIIGLIIGIVGLIFWYLISCLIVWIYEKFKKKIQ